MLLLAVFPGVGAFAEAPAPRDASASEIVALPGRGGMFGLQFGLGVARGAVVPPNGFILSACGTNLLDPGRLQAAPGTAPSGGPALADVLVDGAGPDLALSQSLPVVERLSSNDWEYVVVDATAAYGKRLIRFRRHLLFVQTNLFVIYDDLVAAAPATIEYRFRSPGELQLEDRSGDLRLETSAAGFTGHWLSSAARSFAPWRLGAAPPGTQAGRVWSRLSTNELIRARTLTVMIPHCAGQKKGTGFKLLESDTAIGARIYRDGLPTLVAFRTVDSGEANLTGLKFSAPLAVDVFRPKPRRR